METQKIDLCDSLIEEDNRGPVVGSLTWKERVYPLYNGDNIIGRGSQCDVIIDHSTVSDTHCEIVIADNKAICRDLRSSNGTFIENYPPGSRDFVQLARSQKVEVRNGCAVRFGIIHCSFSFRSIMNMETQPQDEYAVPDSPEDDAHISLNLGGITGLEAHAAARAVFDEPTQCMPGVCDPPSGRLSSKKDNTVRSGTGVFDAETQFPGDLLQGSHTVVDSPTQVVEDDDEHTVVGDETDVDGDDAAEGDGITGGGVQVSISSTSLQATCSTSKLTDTRLEKDDESSCSSSSESQDLMNSPKQIDDDVIRLILPSDQLACSPTPQDPSLHTVSKEHAHSTVTVQDTDTSSIVSASPLIRVPPKTGRVKVLGPGCDESNCSPAELHSADTSVTGKTATLPHVLVPDVAVRHTSQSLNDTNVEDKTALSEDDMSTCPQNVPEINSVRSLTSSSQSTAPQEVQDIAHTRDLCTKYEDKTPCSRTVGEAKSEKCSPVKSTEVSVAEQSRQATGKNNTTLGPVSFYEPQQEEAETRLSTVENSKEAKARQSSDTASGIAKGRKQSSRDIEGDSVSEVEASSTRSTRGKSVKSTSSNSSQPVENDTTGNSSPGIAKGRKQSSRDIEGDSVSEVEASSTRSTRGKSVKSTSSNSSQPVENDTTGNSSSGIAKGRKRPRRDIEGDSVSEVEASSTRSTRGKSVKSTSSNSSQPIEGDIEDDSTGNSSSGIAKGRKQSSRDIEGDSVSEVKASSTRSTRGKSVKSASSNSSPPVENDTTGNSSSGIAKGRKQSSRDIEGDSVSEVEASSTRSTRGKSVKSTSSNSSQPIEGDIEDDSTGNSSSGIAKGRKQSSRDIEGDSVSEVKASSTRSTRGKSIKSTSSNSSQPVENDTTGNSSSGIAKGRKRPRRDIEGDSGSVVGISVASDSVNLSRKGVQKSLQENCVRNESSGLESFCRDSSSDVTPVRILFTGVDRDEEMERMVRCIGAEIVNDPLDGATHCITANALKRTPKLLISINCGVKYVVSTHWLVDSSKAGRPLDINLDARGSAAYIVKDPKKEKQWKFSLVATLKKARSSVPGIFNGISFYITKGVCGSGAPPTEEMQQIIESGGGEWITVLPRSRKKQDSFSRPIVISCDGAASKEITKTVMDFARSGPGAGIYTVEFVFLAILRQSVEFDSGLLEGYSF